MSDPRYTKPVPLPGRALNFVLVTFFRALNRKVPWHRLGKWSGLANLLALRAELREHNLHDTDSDLTQPKRGCPFHKGQNASRKRTEEGTHNDLFYPAMGCRYSRLGRNMRARLPIEQEESLLTPNPYEISAKILRRQKFIPAEGLNLLAAAWIQFQVHDWFGHENEELSDDPADPQNQDKQIQFSWADSEQIRSMTLPKTKPDPTNWPNSKTASSGGPAAKQQPIFGRYPANRNRNPQWWDGSQVYGESISETLQLRTNPATGQLEPHGKLALEENHLLPVNPLTHSAFSGFTDNWWLGLELLHTLFAREHNSICDALRQNEPHLVDQEIFEIARLINCALMAKIHTVEWTPGILGHPALQPALDANWKGMIGHFFSEETARTLAGWLPAGVIKELLTGIPMTEPDHHGVPYALTEEFACVYRLHPLIPDQVTIRRFPNGEESGVYNMTEIAFENSRTPLAAGATMTDVLYSFGVEHPGAIVAQNYPDFLRDLVLPPDPTTGRVQQLDLAAVDIIRDRERGVPRYCEFRRQLRMPVPKTWKEAAGTRPDLEQELRRIYDDNLEALDTMVGMFLEDFPAKFGFSDTAFRIFILMASRRLKSDRFFTSDYSTEFYTKTGLDWISASGMQTVITRHFPELSVAFEKNQNPFAPWKMPTEHTAT